MANDLYGELLARALQRRAPPGHFPAFVTPGEANLLRSHGGGVAPGGGQYMAGGIPAFSYGSEAGFGQGEGEPGTGFGGDAPGGGDYGSAMSMEEAIALGMGLGKSGYPGHAVGEHGWSFEPTQDEISMAQQTLAQHKAEEEAAAARAAAAMEAQFQAKAAAQSKAAAQAQAQAKVDKAQNRIEFENALTEQIALNPYPSPVDETAEQMTTNLALAATATSLAMDETEAYDAHEAALDALDAPISEGGIGRFSPANSWGLRSEVALNNKDETGRRGISIADLQALNAQDHQGYAITNPQPTAASIAASHVFSQLNPTVANAVIGLSSLVAPGPAGFAATIAALMEEKGLLNMPAMRSIPGIQAISDILDIPQDFVAQIMEGITDPIGDVLSQGTEALADALSGFLGPEESAGPDDAGEVDGGAPDIEIVPDLTTDTDVAPAPPVRTFADVDDETRRRILANIISGLQRTDRPTEGVTAFGPLFV